MLKLLQMQILTDPNNLLTSFSIITLTVVSINVSAKNDSS